VLSLACISLFVFQRTASTGLPSREWSQPCRSSCGRANCDVTKRRDESVANHDHKRRGVYNFNSLPPSHFNTDRRTKTGSRKSREGVGVISEQANSVSITLRGRAGCGNGYGKWRFLPLIDTETAKPYRTVNDKHPEVASIGRDPSNFATGAGRFR